MAKPPSSFENSRIVRCSNLSELCKGKAKRPRERETKGAGASRREISSKRDEEKTHCRSRQRRNDVAGRKLKHGFSRIFASATIMERTLASRIDTTYRKWCNTLPNPVFPEAVTAAEIFSTDFDSDANSQLVVEWKMTIEEVHGCQSNCGRVDLRFHHEQSSTRPISSKCLAPSRGLSGCCGNVQCWNFHAFLNL